MLRWLSFVGVLVAVLTVSGCGSKVKEIPPAEAAPQAAPDPGETMKKAMQGMPEEMRKKMEAQMKK